MAIFKDFCNSANVTLRRDNNNQVGFMEKTVHSSYTGKDETYRIMTGDKPDGTKILFIPSLNVFNDVMNGKMKFGDAEVVDEGYTTTEGNVPILFLHKQATFAGSVSDDQLGF